MEDWELYGNEEFLDKEYDSHIDSMIDNARWGSEVGNIIEYDLDLYYELQEYELYDRYWKDITEFYPVGSIEKEWSFSVVDSEGNKFIRKIHSRIDNGLYNVWYGMAHIVMVRVSDERFESLSIKYQPPIPEVYKDNLDDYKKTLRDYNRAIKLNPGEYELYSERGYIKGCLGNHKGAIQDFKKAIELDDLNNGLLYINMGISKYYLKDIEGAWMDWSEAANNGSCWINGKLLYYQGGTYLRRYGNLNLEDASTIIYG